MKMWVTTVALGVVLVVVLAGCGLDAHPPEGRLQCTEDAQCPARWVCRSDNFCWRLELDAGVSVPDVGVDTGTMDAAMDSGLFDGSIDVSTDAMADAGGDAGFLCESGAECDPLEPCGCAEGTRCSAVSGGTVECVSGGAGVSGDPCPCANGYVCLNLQGYTACRRVCALGETECGGAVACHVGLSDGDEIRYRACSIDCDPITNDGCRETGYCTIPYSMSGGFSYTQCYAHYNTATEGEPCRFHNDCPHGFGCEPRANTCRKWCSNNGDCDGALCSARYRAGPEGAATSYGFCPE